MICHLCYLITLLRTFRNFKVTSLLFYNPELPKKHDFVTSFIDDPFQFTCSVYLCLYRVMIVVFVTSLFFCNKLAKMPIPKFGPFQKLDFVMRSSYVKKILMNQLVLTWLAGNIVKNKVQQVWNRFQDQVD